MSTQIDYTVLASGLYLSQPLTRNWGRLSEPTVHEICGRTVLEAYSGYDGSGLWSLIEESANHLRTTLTPIVAHSTELTARLHDLESELTVVYASLAEIVVITKEALS